MLMRVIRIWQLDEYLKLFEPWRVISLYKLVSTQVAAKSMYKKKASVQAAELGDLHGTGFHWSSPFRKHQTRVSLL